MNQAASPENARSLNWLEDTSRSLAASFPSLGSPNSVYIAHRLSMLLLCRLPPDVSRALLQLLPDALGTPDTPARLSELYLAADLQPDVTISYSAFIEQASHSIQSPVAVEENFIERIVDYFLWAFAHALPPELKSQILEHLPVDLRNRMNLRSSQADDAKVA